MKRVFLSLFIALLGLGFTAADVEAKRLGGGSSQGLRRPLPPARSTPDTPPTQQAPAKPAATPSPTANPGAPVAPAPRRSWLGPIAGIAAGLGIAALLSHFGLGAGFANLLTMLLMVVVAVVVVRWLLRRFAPGRTAAQDLRYAGAGTAGSAWRGEPSFTPSAVALPATTSTVAALPDAGLPAGMDRAELERAAKTIFLRMQAANDAGDLDDLRQFSTPEMYAAFRLDLQDRHDAPQRTDVVKLDADFLDAATEGDRQIVSVRFHGLVREDHDAAAMPFDEVWHLVRPADGSRPWAIAGIQQAVTH
ncbi:MAG: TIM44-like domain-containing protein [Rhizobacter sp.]